VRTLLVIGLLALAGCGADVQMDSLCVTTAGYTILSARVPGVTSTPLPTIQLGFTVGAAIPDLRNSGVHDVHAWFRSLQLDSTASTAFVTSLTVRAVAPSGSSLPKVALGTYQRPASGAGTTLRVPGNGADVFPYLQSGRLVLEISGVTDPSQAPNGAFTVDAQVCTEVEGSVDYL
jgi:hypothetical protein